MANSKIIAKCSDKIIGQKLEVAPPDAINCFEKIAPLIFRHNLLRPGEPTRRSPALPVNFSDLA